MPTDLRWRIALPFALIIVALILGELLAVAVVLGGVRLAGDQAGLAVSRLGLAFAAMGLVAIIVTVTWSISLARWLADPLDRLTIAARRVGEGDLSDGLIVDGPEEARRLASALNTSAAELRRTILRLRHEGAELEAVLASMADAVIIVDNLGLVRRLNAAAERLLGVSDSDARSRSLSSVTRRHELESLFDQSVSLDGPLVVEIGPERRQAQVLVSSMGGRPRERVIVFQDVTELRHAEAMRRDFVANVSHELRTPLASLRALVETLEGGALEDPPAAREFLVRMHDEVDGLTQMVEELLELARIESGRLRLRAGRTDLVQLAREVSERLRPQAERSEVVLEVFPADVEIDAIVDRDRFRQVFINLIHNAIKFTPAGGTVRVTVEPRGAAVAVVVADTGVGILPDDLPRIFERFYKADRARSSPGTGLGLAIVKHLVQLHGGQVWAESSGPGRGSSFTVVVPA